MKYVFIAAACVAVLAPACGGQEPDMKNRWVFSFGYRRNRADVEKIKSLVDTAAAHGLNGMVLSSFGLDSITRWKEKDVALLKEVAAYCAKKNIELIPTGFSVGYGGGALGHDRNFAAGLPTTIALTAKGGKLVVAGAENLMVNGGLEEHKNGRFSGYAFHDKPGKVTFPDTVAASGKTSIRFEGFGAGPHGHGRIMQRVAVVPGRSYRFSFRIKTEKLRPVSGLKGLVLREKGGSVADFHPALKPTQDWTEVSLTFLNQKETKVLVYAGIWGGKTGKFWVDDMKLCEDTSLADIVHREGAPLELKSRDRKVTFAEGKDFRKIPNMRQLDHVRLAPGTTIREGEKLELSCYRIPGVMHSWGKQMSLCMSNPKLYEYWEAQAKKLHEILRYKRFLLSMDEIRNGGGCQLCLKRKLSMAEILGDCVTKQRAIFEKIDPKIEVLIWSDMLDPAHNARNNYYGVVGDFTGSWKHVPKDLTIMCWYHKIRNKSLAFFSREGFRTFGAAYYDADDLTNPREWLASLKKTPNAQGIMYTTWQKKYRLLAGFGDLVSGKK
jgi:hypothetical protein